LTPELFPWLPTVLVNDGHDHFVVANSGSASGSLSSSKGGEWRTSGVRGIAALVSSSFKAYGLTKNKRLVLPQLKEALLIALARTVIGRSSRTPSSGRAPPALLTQSYPTEPRRLSSMLV
jgi:hypothetical protein